MKNFLKKHWVIILIFLGCISFLGYECLSYKNDLKQSYQMIEKTCKEEKDRLTKKEQEYCENLNKDELLNPDFYMYMQEIVLFRCKNLFYPLITYLGLLIPTVYGFNFIDKKNKKELRKNIFKKAYQYIWLWPTIIGVLLLFCQINAGPVNQAFISQMWKYNPILKNHGIYSFYYLLKVLLHSMLFINIILLVYRKQQKPILTILFSTLIHAFLLVFTELGFTSFFQIIFHSDIGMIFNIGNGFYIYDTWKFYYVLLTSLSWVILSGILVYVFYQDERKFIADFNNRE